MLCSIDPGLRHCGVALWDVSACKLKKAALVCGAADNTDAAAWVKMADNVAAFVSTHGGQSENLAIEMPQIYVGPRAKGDNNDLIQLAAVVGGITHALGLPTRVYRPAQWKGQVPKDIMCKRVQGRLSPEELAAIDFPIKSLQHNVWDGIGIGLKYLGRL